MKAWILAVGDEVLSGRVINTNASYLSMKLESIGIVVVKSLVVGDDYNSIEEEVNRFKISDAELLITTGGLGPTHDDFTKECIAKVLGLELVPYQEAFDLLNNYFQKSYNSCNDKQAYFPKNSILIPNDLGTADGCIISLNNKTIMELVGPHYELVPMFDKTCLPYLMKLTNNELLVKEYTIMGVGESQIEPTIMEIKERNPLIGINPYCSIGKIRYQVSSLKKYGKEFNQAITDFELTLKPYIISDKNEQIEVVLINKLRNLNYTLSCAESCTGGMIISKLIGVSGASNVIKESLVTYANQSKEKYLKVKEETIKKYDVASLEVAEEMAMGLGDLTHSNVCISVTGVAGPTTDNPKKPVGTVYYGIKINDKIIVEEKHFNGDRDLVRQRATMWILYRTFSLLNE